MAENHYRDAVPCKLSDYITPDIFRTVMYDQLKIPGGITEISVEIMLKKETAKKLSFKVPRDGMVYGFARIKPKVKEIFAAEDAKLFMVDSTSSATNTIVWYDDIITALRKGMPRFDSSKCGTFLDFRKRR